MNIDVELQDPYMFSTWPIYLTLGLFAFSLIVVAVYFLLLRKKIKDKPIEIKKPPMSLVAGIKKKYLDALIKIEDDVTKGKIDNRKAYRELSSVIRLFVFDMTGIKVQNYTLTEISILKIKPLTTLVAEYYSPEFEEGENGNIKSSLDKTRGVIQRWR